jgi:ketosteroid isomerase-like protein
MITGLTVVATICALQGLLPLAAAAESAGEPERELMTIQAEWADARVKADIAYLEHLYAKEFRVHSMNGSVASRADDIAMFKEGRIKPDFVRDEDMSVAIYNDVGVVTGIEKVGGKYPAGPLKGQYAEFALRFSNVFVRRDGRWQIVLHQGTLIPSK